MFKQSDKYKLLYESIGGFKTTDKYHMKRMKNQKKKEKSCEPKDYKPPYRTTITLISDKEEKTQKDF